MINYKDYPLLPSLWCNRLQGKTAFVFGGGCSVNKYKRLYDRLTDHIIIGLNRCFPPYLDIKPNFVLWNDVSLWLSEEENLNKLDDSIFLCRRDCAPQHKAYFFDLLPKLACPKGIQTLKGLGSSGQHGVQLAYLLGCTSIVIIGLDGQLGKNKQTDFYGNNKFYNNISSAMERHARGVVWTDRFCRAKNIQLYNFGNNKIRKSTHTFEWVIEKSKLGVKKDWIKKRLFIGNEQSVYKNANELYILGKMT